MPNPDHQISATICRDGSARVRMGRDIELARFSRWQLDQRTDRRLALIRELEHESRMLQIAADALRGSDTDPPAPIIDRRPIHGCALPPVHGCALPPHLVGLRKSVGKAMEAA